MGLIKAALGSASGLLADQWREYFYAESLDSDTLVIKGSKKNSDKSSNTKGSDNLISNGSIIAVNEGQCMIIVDQGAIVEVSAEAGEFVYDSSKESSIFYGNLGTNIVETFKKFVYRFGFGGDTARDTRVYYFNTKEILGNKYGTVNPIPFRVVDTNIGLDVEISLKCHGEYSYKLIDPILFYKNVSGNVSGIYTRDLIDSQLRSELLSAMQPAFGRLAERGVRYYTIASHTEELAKELNDILSDKWAGTYGIAISRFGVSSVEAPKEDQEMIKELQKTAVFKNPTMAAANLAAAQAEAMKAAASNTATGPMMAFAGMNMASQSGGLNAQSLYEMGAGQVTASATAAPQQTSPSQAVPTSPNTSDVETWSCHKGHTGNTGKFCTECGEPKPASSQSCSSCGYTPSEQTPKFCPDCGAPFNK